MILLHIEIDFLQLEESMSIIAIAFKENLDQQANSKTEKISARTIL